MEYYACTFNDGVKVSLSLGGNLVVYHATEAIQYTY